MHLFTKDHVYRKYIQPLKSGPLLKNKSNKMVDDVNRHEASLEFVVKIDQYNGHCDIQIALFYTLGQLN